MVGSKAEELIEIPDDELADLDKDERRDFIEAWMLNEMWGLIEWGYDEIDQAQPAPGSTLDCTAVPVAEFGYVIDAPEVD